MSIYKNFVKKTNGVWVYIGLINAGTSIGYEPFSNSQLLAHSALSLSHTVCVHKPNEVKNIENDKSKHNLFIAWDYTNSFDY